MCAYIKALINETEMPYFVLQCHERARVNFCSQNVISGILFVLASRTTLTAIESSEKFCKSLEPFANHYCCCLAAVTAINIKKDQSSRQHLVLQRGHYEERSTQLKLRHPIRTNRTQELITCNAQRLYRQLRVQRRNSLGSVIHTSRTIITCPPYRETRKLDWHR